MINSKKISHTILLFLLFVGFMVMAGGCGNSTQAVTDSQIESYNKPGIVYISTTWSADVDYPKMTFDSAALSAFANNEITAGRVPDTAGDYLATAIVELVTHSGRYLLPAETRTKSMDMVINGNGFIINPDGNIITTADMVKQSDDELKQGMANAVVQEAGLDELKAFESALSNLAEVDISLDEAQRLTFFKALADNYTKYLTVGIATQKIQVYPGNMLDQARNGEDGLTAQVVKAGDTLEIDKNTGKDVAILKVNGSQMPTVQLGDDNSGHDGSRVLGLGYENSKSESETDSAALEDKPTLATGTVTKHLSMTGDWNLMQLQMQMVKNASGSPILDSNSKAIGIMVLITSTQTNDSGEATTVTTEQYAVPISVAKDYLSQANVTASSSTLDTTYRQGVDLASEKHYSAAKEKFNETKNTKPDFPFIQSQLNNSQTNIDNGLDEGTFPWTIVIIVVVVVVVVLALILLLILFMKHKKKKGNGPADGVGI